VEIVENHFGNHLNGTNGDRHFELSGDKVGDHHGIDGADHSPGNRFQYAFEMFVFASVADKPFFDGLI